MNTITQLTAISPRVESIEQLVSILPECIQRAAEDVGPQGVKAFFDGYKLSLDEQKLAA